MPRAAISLRAFGKWLVFPRIAMHYRFDLRLSASRHLNPADAGATPARAFSELFDVGPSSVAAARPQSCASSVACPDQVVHVEC